MAATSDGDSWRMTGFIALVKWWYCQPSLAVAAGCSSGRRFSVICMFSADPIVAGLSAVVFMLPNVAASAAAAHDRAERRRLQGLAVRGI